MDSGRRTPPDLAVDPARCESAARERNRKPQKIACQPARPIGSRSLRFPNARRPCSHFLFSLPSHGMMTLENMVHMQIPPRHAIGGVGRGKVRVRRARRGGVWYEYAASAPVCKKVQGKESVYILTSHAEG